MILPLVESATEESRRRAGSWIACRPGCGECCHAVFAITAADAQRLREGLDRLPGAPRNAIVSRARSYRDAIRDVFPGEWSSGTLDANEEWRAWFFSRQLGTACPALDPASQSCALYAHRPVACRLHGHLIRIGEHTTTRCALCFQGAAPADLSACTVDLPLPSGEPEAETIVALALCY